MRGPNRVIPKLSVHVTETDCNVRLDSLSEIEIVSNSSSIEHLNTVLLRPSTRFDMNSISVNETFGGAQSRQNATQSASNFKRFSSKQIQTSTQRVNVSTTPAPPSTSMNTTLTTNMGNARLDVHILEEAKPTWRALRALQSNKLQLELRIAHNQRLIDTDHFPDWEVSFSPPLKLLDSLRAIESTVGFRYEEAKQQMNMLNDLMREHSGHISNQIRATLGLLECHNRQPNANGYDTSEVLDALMTL